MASVLVYRKLYTDGRVEEVKDLLSLFELQTFVGGYIEYVPSNVTGCSLIINEEGIRLELAPNAEATKLVRPDVWVLGTIRGNALLVDSDEQEEGDDVEDDD